MSLSLCQYCRRVSAIIFVQYIQYLRTMASAQQAMHVLHFSTKLVTAFSQQVKQGENILMILMNRSDAIVRKKWVLHQVQYSIAHGYKYE
jgi:hypothetical protein